MFVLTVPGGIGVRFSLWLAVALSYTALWFALAAAVVTLRGSSAKHAVVLAALWLVLAILLPAAINLAIKIMAPMPSRVELILALRDATDAATTERSKLLSAFFEDHPELAGTGGSSGDFVTLQLVTGQRVERDLAPVLTRYEDHVARQQALLDRLQYLSPALLAETALADSAGTGLPRHHWFFSQVIAHHAELRVFFDPRALRKEKFSGWDEVPTFQFVEEPTMDVVARVAPTIAVFVGITLALALWVWRTLVRRPADA
jgi:ABC-2 type transport system permease protein